MEVIFLIFPFYEVENDYLEASHAHGLIFTPHPIPLLHVVLYSSALKKKVLTNALTDTYM